VRTGLEDARIAAEGLRTRVAGRRLERGVDVFDPAGAVGDDHGIRSRLDDARKQLDLLDPLLDQREVTENQYRALDLLLHVADRRRVDAEPDALLGSVAEQEQLEVADDLALQRPSERLVCRRARRHHVGKEAAERAAQARGELAGAVHPEQPPSGRVGQETGSLEIPDDDAVGESLDDMAKQGGGNMRRVAAVLAHRDGFR
jgi:hypothetical protein